MTRFDTRAAVLGGTATAMTYVMGIAVGFLIGEFMFERLPGHLSNPLRSTLAALPAIGGLVTGSVTWGIWMGRLAKCRETGRMAWTGGLGLVPITLLVGVGLMALESTPSRLVGSAIPDHVLFAILFVPTAFLITSTGALVLVLGLRRPALVRPLWWRAGLAAALVFLIIDLIMDALGWRVGAPGAAERFTMVTVTFAGGIGAALAGGATIGSAVAGGNTSDV